MPRRRRKGIVEAYHPGYIFTITKREALGYISLGIVLRNNIVFDRCGNVNEQRRNELEEKRKECWWCGFGG